MIDAFKDRDVAVNAVEDLCHCIAIGLRQKVWLRKAHALKSWELDLLLRFSMYVHFELSSVFSNRYIKKLISAIWAPTAS